MTVYARIQNQITTVPSYPNGLKIGAYLFPTSDGSNGQALITNGSGTVSWGNAGAQLSGTNTWTGTQTFSNATYSALFTGGNVGIGTSSPNLKSEIWQIASGGTNVATSALRTTPQLLLKGFGGSSTYHSGIAFSMNEHTSGYWGSGILSHDDTGLYGSALTFYTSTGLASASPTEKMRITSSGNVGIGTSSPGSKLDVAGSINTSNSLTIGSQGGTIDDYSAGNQALRIYTNTAGKGLWIGFPGGIVLNNPTMIVGSLAAGAGGAFLNSTVSDNFILRTQTNTPNPNWSIGYGDGSGSIDTTKEYLVSNAGTITVKSGNFNVTGSTLLGSYLSLGQVPNQIGGTRYTVHESMAKSQSSAATPNQSIRWTWYNDADGAIVGTRQYQLWVYPYSNQSGTLAIFDQMMAFSIPTYTETSINVSGITTGGRYIITSLGNTTQAQWNAMAGTSGNTYAVNNWFNAATNGPSGTTGTVIYTSYTKLIVNNAPTQFNNSVTFAAVSVSANTTIDSTYTHYFASGTITITLPTAVGIAGRTYWIKRTGTGTITIATTASQTIDGAASLSITAQYDSYTLVSDGSNWFIM